MRSHLKTCTTVGPDILSLSKENKPPHPNPLLPSRLVTACEKSRSEMHYHVSRDAQALSKENSPKAVPKMCSYPGGWQKFKETPFLGVFYHRTQDPFVSQVGKTSSQQSPLRVVTASEKSLAAVSR